MASRISGKEGLFEKYKDVPGVIVSVISILALIIAGATGAYTYFAKEEELRAIDCLGQNYRKLSTIVDRINIAQMAQNRKTLEVNLLNTKEDLLKEVNKSLPNREVMIRKMLFDDLGKIQKQIEIDRNLKNYLIQKLAFSPGQLTKDCKSSI